MYQVSFVFSMNILYRNIYKKQDNNNKINNNVEMASSSSYEKEFGNEVLTLNLD